MEFDHFHAQLLMTDIFLPNDILLTRLLLTLNSPNF